MERRLWRGAMLAAVTALALSTAACGLVGGEDATSQAAAAGDERDADGTTLTGTVSDATTNLDTSTSTDTNDPTSTSDPTSTDTGGGGGSQLSRSDSDAASDVERRVAETLSDLNAETLGGDTVIRVPDTVLFEFDQHELLPGAADTLDRLAEVVRHYADAPVRVEGHTDSVGEDAYNQQLSERRAQAVADALVSAGVQAGRLRAQGFGETRPVAPNAGADGSDSPDGRAQNRRVEVILVGVDAAELGE